MKAEREFRLSLNDLDNEPTDFNIQKFEYFCAVCNSHVIEDSKHCKMCNRCTMNFVHHCNIVNNDIGSINYRKFAVMIGTALVLLIF